MDRPPRRGDKRGRGGKDGRDGNGKARPGRRTPPPEGTGLEAKYLGQQKETIAPIVIRLRDGRTIEGVIESYDASVITVRTADGPPLAIRKTDIRYLQEDEG